MLAATKTWDVIIIGAGHNGLVASFYLARAGLSVLVLEAGQKVGGACITEEVFPGYLHETCASSFYAFQPEVLRDTKLVERGLTLITGGVGGHIYPDGRRLFLNGDEANDFEQVAQFSVKDAQNYQDWLSFELRISRLLAPYVMKPPVSLSDIFADYRGTSEEALLSRVVTASIGGVMGDFFDSEEIITALWNPIELGSMWENGSGLGFALARAVTHREIEGVTRPVGGIVGGIGEVTRLLAVAAEEEGVRIRTSSPVRKILVESGVAAGVQIANGDEIAARFVVSNADPKRTFLTLLAEGDLEPQFLRRVRGLRAMYGSMKFICTLSEMPVFYAAEDLNAESVGGVRIRPTYRYRELVWEDVRRGRLPRAPMAAISHPSVNDPSRAPAGKHTGQWFIEFAPYHLEEGAWDERRDEMAEILLDLIDQYSPNYRRAIIDYKVITPWDLEIEKRLTDGNIHHVDVIPSLMLDQRPLPELSQYRTPIRDLYLCGAGMHPWGEVTGAPGHNAAHQVLGDLDDPRR